MPRPLQRKQEKGEKNQQAEGSKAKTPSSRLQIKRPNDSDLQRSSRIIIMSTFQRSLQLQTVSRMPDKEWRDIPKNPGILP